MITRISIAGIVTGIVCFFPSALIYGLLSDYVNPVLVSVSSLSDAS